MKSPKRNRELKNKKNELNHFSKNKKWRPMNFNESYGDDDEDGWEDLNGLYSLEDFFSKFHDYRYEIENSVRGCYTGCKTYEELADYTEELANELSSIAYDIRNAGR